MLLASALLLLPCYGTGSSGVPATVANSSSALTGRETLPLAATETLVFVGIEGDFSGDQESAMEARLGKEFGLRIIGSPVRPLSNKTRLVWAVRGTDPEKALTKMKRPLRKDGYDVERLHGTAMALLGSSGSALKRGLRDLEREEERVWASYASHREQLVWTFHEPKQKPDKLLDALRDLGVKASFHHQELSLASGPGADLDALAKQAGESLDLVRAVDRDSELLLDLYLRDVDHFLALDRGKSTIACPNVLGFLEDVPAGRLSWKVTLDNRGFPFED